MYIFSIVMLRLATFSPVLCGASLLSLIVNIVQFFVYKYKNNPKKIATIKKTIKIDIVIFVIAAIPFIWFVYELESSLGGLN